jgi:hypothetical protein
MQMPYGWAMPARRGLIVVAVIATLSVATGACGGDDDSSSSSTTTGDGAAVAPSPTNAFRDFRAAVEAQGMTVTSLPKDQLSGAESGVKITGSKSGMGLLFGAQAEAKNYSKFVSKSGTAKTAMVGTVVFTADTQADADFFASAYEGG